MAKTAIARRAVKRAEPQTRTAWAHGRFHWNELRTRNVERAKRFYEETIGWTFEAMQTPDGEPYWVALAGGKPVAGMFTLTSPEFDGVPESWIGFLAVDDVDKRVAKPSEPAPSW